MRKPFTTSIDTDISDNFKKTCECYNLKMNVVLEAFMQQFSEQQFICSQEGTLLDEFYLKAYVYIRTLQSLFFYYKEK